MSSSNELTVVVGMVGAAVSVACYLLGKRASRNETEQIRTLLKQATEAFTSQIQKLEAQLRKSGAYAATAIAGATSLEIPNQKSTADVLVQASLGALQNASGEVDVQRLQREVGRAMGSPGRSDDVKRALIALRAEHVVSWDSPDNDLSAVRTLLVHPARDSGPSPNDPEGSVSVQ